MDARLNKAMIAIMNVEVNNTSSKAISALTHLKKTEYNQEIKESIFMEHMCELVS